jgi:hypothetical protein
MGMRDRSRQSSTDRSTQRIDVTGLKELHRTTLLTYNEAKLNFR